MKHPYWKELLKFLSGAFFVTAGASCYFAYLHMEVPFLNSSMKPDFLILRGFLHFGLFVLSFYFGFIKKTKKN